jgi:hypothetical protein
MPFDGRTHAFIGDSLNGQPPMTVIIASTNFLHAANAIQVPTVAKLEQLLQEEPDLPQWAPLQWETTIPSWFIFASVCGFQIATPSCFLAMVFCSALLGKEFIQL